MIEPVAEMIAPARMYGPRMRVLSDAHAEITVNGCQPEVDWFGKELLTAYDDGGDIAERNIGLSLCTDFGS